MIPLGDCKPVPMYFLGFLRYVIKCFSSFFASSAPIICSNPISGRLTALRILPLSSASTATASLKSNSCIFACVLSSLSVCAVSKSRSLFDLASSDILFCLWIFFVILAMVFDKLGVIDNIS